MLEKSESTTLPFHTSIYSTSKILLDKLWSEPVDSGKCFYLLLSRAIVNNNQTNQDQKPSCEPKSTKGRKSRIQSANKQSEEEKKKPRVSDSSKKAQYEITKIDSDDEYQDWQWEYNSKEGIYLHNSYDTIYPEYILVIEPIPRQK